MSAPDKLPDVYWLTRDRLGGDLRPQVDIWAVEPKRREFADGDVVWLAPKGVNIDFEDTCVGDWSLAEARREVRNGIPETDRECIRVGNLPSVGRTAADAAKWAS